MEKLQRTFWLTQYIKKPNVVYSPYVLDAELEAHISYPTWPSQQLFKQTLHYTYRWERMS